MIQFLSPWSAIFFSPLMTLPVMALFVLLFYISVIRSLRRIRSLRAEREMLDHKEQSQSHPQWEAFHNQLWLPLCKKLAESLEHKLSRMLTVSERRKIWRAKSILVLQVLIDELQQASDTASIEQLIHSFPSGVDRPDPTNWQNSIDAQ